MVRAVFRWWATLRGERRGLLLLLLLVLIGACRDQTGSDELPLRFWHTFNRAESDALQEWLESEQEERVRTTILPFAQATYRFRDAVENHRCPDLLRIDSTRIPELVEQELIVPAPTELLSGRSWLDEALAQARYEDRLYGLPQSLDGLALIRRKKSGGNWPPASLDALERSALAAPTRPSLGILVDGYWAIAFLRSAGADLPDETMKPPIDGPAARAGLERMASFFHRGLAADVLDELNPSRGLSEMFRSGDIEIIMNGPWALVELSDGNLERLEVAPFPGGAAPRGGQVLTVPSCSRSPERAWRLAKALTAPEVQSKWAHRLGLIPVTREALEQSPRIVHEFYRALQVSHPLPRHPLISQLFDDLTPAVAAVIGEDASAEEALAGVGRSWARLYGMPTLEPVEPDAGQAVDGGPEQDGRQDGGTP